MSAINPALLTPAPATTASALVYYPSTNPTLGNWGDSGVNLLFNGTTRITGVVFPNGTSSVLFFGRHGVGAFCYGEGTTCNDPAYPSRKGDHAYPYEYYVWAYDAHDLAAVKSGAKQPWAIKPYAVWSLTLPTGTDGAELGGAAYDPATGRIFVTQAFGDGEYPVVHVFSVR